MEFCNFSNYCRVIDVELPWLTEWWQLMVIISFLLQICIGTINISKELKTKTINIASSVPILSSLLQNLLPLLFCEPSASSGIFSLFVAFPLFALVFHGLFQPIQLSPPS